MSETMKANLIIPEVMAGMVQTSLGQRISLLPVTTAEDSLVGQPGDTLRFPAFRYIGKAEEVAENGQVSPGLLTADTVSATVKKYAKAVRITDEARLSGLGDPLGEAARQLAYSIDHAVDDALFAQLHSLSLSRVMVAESLSAESVADALTLFLEDLEGPKLLLTDAKGFAALRKDQNYIRASDLGQRMIFSGVVGEIWGCQIVVSQKVHPQSEKGESRAYIVKPGALRLVNKAHTTVEVQREAEFMRDTIYASKHCAAYLYDESRAVALTRFTGLEVIADPEMVTQPAGAGKTAIVLPERWAKAPEGTRWAYKLDDNPEVTTGFMQAVTGSTPFLGNGVAFSASGSFVHLMLLDGASKLLKVANLRTQAG